MKTTRFRILIAVIALCLLTACMQQQAVTQPTETQLTTAPTTEPTNIDHGDCYPIPSRLEFSDLEEYCTLLAAADMDAEELEIYLNSKNYSMNGVRTKEDILRLQAWAGVVPYPSLEDAELEFFHIHTDDHMFFVRYHLDRGTVQAWVYTDSDPVKEEDLEIVQQASEKLDTNNQDVLYYCSADQTPQGESRLTYAAIVDGYQVSFMVFDLSRGEADAAVKAVVFCSLDEALKAYCAA